MSWDTDLHGVYQLGSFALWFLAILANDHPWQGTEGQTEKDVGKIAPGSFPAGPWVGGGYSLLQEPQLLPAALSYSCKLLPCGNNCCLLFLLQAQGWKGLLAPG